MRTTLWHQECRPKISSGLGRSKLRNWVSSPPRRGLEGSATGAAMASSRCSSLRAPHWRGRAAAAAPGRRSRHWRQSGHCACYPPCRRRLSWRRSHSSVSRRCWSEDTPASSKTSPPSSSLMLRRGELASQDRTAATTDASSCDWATVTTSAPSAASSTALVPGGGSPAGGSPTASTSRSRSSRRSCNVASATSSASAPGPMPRWTPSVAGRSSIAIPRACTALNP